MKRIQLYRDAAVDEALTAGAARLGTSRSALVREAVRGALAAYFDGTADPVEELIGVRRPRGRHRCGRLPTSGVRFADTSLWVALHHARDTHHADATAPPRAARRRALRGSCRIPIRAVRWCC